MDKGEKMMHAYMYMKPKFDDEIVESMLGQLGQLSSKLNLLYEGYMRMEIASKLNQEQAIPSDIYGYNRFRL